MMIEFNCFNSNLEKPQQEKYWSKGFCIFIDEGYDNRTWLPQYPEEEILIICQFYLNQKRFYG